MHEPFSPETVSKPERVAAKGGRVAAALSTRVAIVSALEREISHLVAGWRNESVSDGFKHYKVFEGDRATVIVGGIGRAAAGRAAEVALERSHADVLISTGFAGETAGGMSIGGPFTPARVVDTESGSSFATLFGLGVLATSPAVLDRDAKRAAFDRFGAQAVDMEGSAVAEVAQRHGAGFLAVKAISDLHDFPMPPVGRFVDEQGEFRAARFAAWTALHPGTWPAVWQLNRNSAVAGRTLQRLLATLIEAEDLRDVRMGDGGLACG